MNSTKPKSILNTSKITTESQKNLNKRRPSLLSLEDNLGVILKPLFSSSKKEFILINNLIKNWENIVGKKYSKLCAPQLVSFNNPKNQGKLTIIAYNSAIAFFIENNSELIIERIASLSGFKNIFKIIVKQQPQDLTTSKTLPISLQKKQEEFLKNKILNIADQDLALTIANLGRHIINEANKKNPN